MRLAIPLLLLGSAACGRDPSPPAPRAAPPPAPAVARAPAAPAAADGCALAELPSRYPAPARLVAIGDVHGDLAAIRAALRKAGAIDDADRWAGGATWVVQLGDLLDRGDDEQAIIELFERLEGEAAAAGGAFLWLLGNHELMNAAGDFRYVTEGGFRDFTDAPDVDPARADIAALVEGAPAQVKARAAAFLPGGPWARRLAGQNVVVVIGDAVFAHAGLIPTWTDDLAAYNRAARCWLDGGDVRRVPEVATDSEGPVWTRAWGGDDADCGRLREVLGALGVERMVVAHTPQLQGITQACEGRLWRIDTGMAAHYGGPVQVLELVPGAAPKILP